VAELLHTSQAGYLLDLAYVQGLLAEHRSGRGDHSRKIWTVAMFCLWHALSVETAAPVIASAA